VVVGRCCGQSDVITRRDETVGRTQSHSSWSRPWGRQQAIHHRSASFPSADRRSGTYTRREQKHQGSRFLSRSIRLGGWADVHRSVLKWLLTSHFYHSTWALTAAASKVLLAITSPIGTLWKAETFLVRRWRSEKWIVSGSEWSGTCQDFVEISYRDVWCNIIFQCCDSLGNKLMRNFYVRSREISRSYLVT
jgi:hypothetical protein